LRNARAQAVADACKFGPLFRGGHERVGHAGQIVDGVTGLILKFEGEAAGIPQTRNRRREKREGHRLRVLTDIRIGLEHDRADAQLLGLAFFPRDQRDDEAAVVRDLRRIDQVEAAERNDVLNSRNLFDVGGHLLLDGVRAFQRRTFGQPDVDEEVPLIFLRHESAGERFAEVAGADIEQQQRRDDEDRTPHEEFERAHVAAGEAPEHRVEAVVEPAQWTARRPALLQNQFAQRRRKRKRHERRDAHRYGESERKLLVELSGDAADEGGGQEDGDQHECDAADRPGQLPHRLLGRFERRVALLQMVLDGFHHDDGVIDHDADG
jgi:hypothetical protein